MVGLAVGMEVQCECGPLVLVLMGLPGRGGILTRTSRGPTPGCAVVGVPDSECAVVGVRIEPMRLDSLVELCEFGERHIGCAHILPVVQL